MGTVLALLLLGILLTALGGAALEIAARSSSRAVNRDLPT
ncbi:hypothetical protein EDE08_10849 [Bradyrhizobium sp. R2.2-H]|jgi:hypothetical protein|nr:hypothetical protein EDE10_10849 [Bradyrhizobium sp. Y-H1]TCU70793.1 hypothetical protein EDE08_10849 [Bradyrhizobium sp. R2.2-H]